MSGHTKGPWDFSWEIQPNGCPTVGSKGLMVCMVAHSAKDPSQRETALANASLIAAAPDLLEACVSALEELKKYVLTPHPEGSDGAREFCVKVMHIEAVIAKARGEE